jgi:phenylglyoxylate dehydrogenase epsilon subunit
MSVKKHLIVGSGAAGLSALREIRSISAEDMIKMVSMEGVLPYSPTSLSYLLSGKIEEAKLWTANEDYLKEMKCTLAVDKKLTKILPERKEVVFQGGEREGYDTLLIATGSEPVMPAIEGMKEIAFLGFHTLQDYKEILQQLGKEKVVLVYGGGLVAMQLASGLTKRGCKVKILVRSRILRRYFDADAGALISEAFLRNGVDIVTGNEIKRIEKKNGRVEVTFTDGSSLAGDLFINCLGTTPRISFLKDSGIKVDNGIVVDDSLRTSAEGVYAAGDVAEAKDFFTGQLGLNPILPSAVEQGKIAGANMAGERRTYEGWISMNVFHFFGSNACSIGLSEAKEDVKVLKEVDRKQGWFKKFSFNDGRLLGAEFINIDVDPGVILYLIKNKLDVGKYREQLFLKPAEVSRWLMLKNEKEAVGKV